MNARTGILALATVVLATSGRPASQPAMSPIPGTGTLRVAPSDTFSFIVAGDNRPPSPSDTQPPTPKQIFDSAAAAHVPFVLWTGDMIYGLDSTNASTTAAQYKEFFKLATRAGAPVFAAPGNHEMDVKLTHGDTTIEVGSSAMQRFYRTAFGLADTTPIYGTFVYANSRFILLNTEEIAPAGMSRAPRAAPSAKVKLDPGYVSPAQIAWLANVLASDSSLHTFVLSHHPLKAKKRDMALDPACASQLEKLFKKYPRVSYVLASHEHLYYNATSGDTASPPSRTDPTKDKPYYLISGGAGAKLTGTPAKGGFHNYLMFTVRGPTVTARVVRLP